MKLVTLAIGVALGGLVLFGLVSVAHADIIDPQLFVCTGCTSPPGGDPNTINPASFNIGVAGSSSLVAPLLVIVGVPGTGSAPTLSLPSGVSAASGATYFGLKAATSGGTSGVLEGTLAAGLNAYTVTGLTVGSGGGPSESFLNWTTSPFPNKATNPDAGITSFNLYAYAISYALNTSGNPSPITTDLSNLAFGSYVIAYGCTSATSGGNTGACIDGSIGATPFTNAGFVPEPTSAALYGMGILGFAGYLRRRVGFPGMRKREPVT